MKTQAYRYRFCAVSALARLLLFSSGTVMAVSPEEQLRIEALLAAVGAQGDSLNYAGAGSRASTVKGLIDRLASSSSFSGKPHMIRRQGQPGQEAGPYLHHPPREVAPLLGSAAGLIPPL